MNPIIVKSAKRQGEKLKEVEKKERKVEWKKNNLNQMILLVFENSKKNKARGMDMVEGSLWKKYFYLRYH